MLVPTGSVVAGGLLALFWEPGPKVRSAVQHFAAGVVFAALSIEILPRLSAHPGLARSAAVEALLAGFAAGVALMLGIRSFFARAEKAAAGGRFPISLVAATGVDVLLDGFLLGLALSAGKEAGLILTIALAMELFFLGLTTVTSLKAAGVGRLKSSGVLAGAALTLVLGVGAASLALTGLSEAWMEVALAFGAAALLYLVTEELLVEAHECPETPLLASTFFLGFIAIFLLDLYA